VTLKGKKQWKAFERGEESLGGRMFLYFFHILQFFLSSYAKVIAILIWNNLFLQKLNKILQFSLKVGCVRYRNVKGFLNLKFLLFFRCFLKGEGEGMHEGKNITLGWCLQLGLKVYL
jgi:hypothetical protein